MPRDDYTLDPLTDEQAATLAALTDPAAFGGAVAHKANPCVVIYGVPVWVMPNGRCRIGAPEAPLVDADQAVRVIERVIEEVDRGRT